MWISHNLPIIVNIFEIFNLNLSTVHKEAKAPATIRYQFSNDAIIAANAFAQDRFPDNFLFGFTTNYETKEKSKISDKGKSLWSHILQSKSNVMNYTRNDDVNAESYNVLKSNVHLVKNLGANAFRISLSWSRILPTGFSDNVNQDGIRYYNYLINEMLKNNINPIVTLHDTDLPDKIQQMGGWSNHLIVTWFNEFAKTAFESFGDRVKHWVTISNPYNLCNKRFSSFNSAEFNKTGISNYICGHHVLLAHSKVYGTYDRDFRWKQKGVVGIALDALWFEVKNPRMYKNFQAADQLFQFANGWFLHPILGKSGDYPEIMKKRISEISSNQNFTRSRLPSFKISEILMIRNTIDFLGLNYQCASMVQAEKKETLYPLQLSPKLIDMFYIDAGAKIISSKRNCHFSQNSPWALKNYLIRINKEYKVPPIYILENAYSGVENMQNTYRVNNHQDHLWQLLETAKLGFDIRGYLDRNIMNLYD